MTKKTVQNTRIFPDFFLLGAGKGGTTSLYNWLSQHSEICMSSPKEPAFFWGEFDNGMEFYRQTYFNHLKDELLAGDASHRNLYYKHAPPRIFSVKPEARFILSLRNPVEMSLSSYWHCFRRGKVSSGFEDEIKINYERIKSGRQAVNEAILKAGEIEAPGSCTFESAILDTGYYAEQIERYLKFFTLDRFKIFLMEDMKKDPMALMKKTCEFLDVDPDECDGFDFSVKNQGTPLKFRPRNLSRLWVNFASNIGGKPVLDRLGNIGKRPEMNAETRSWLVEHFRLHNKRLAQILGRNLDHWNQ